MARDYSLVRRFIIGAILWSTALLITVAVLLSWIYRQAVYRGFDDTLEGTISVLIAYIETNTSGDILNAHLPIDARYQTAFSGHYWVISAIDESQKIKYLITSRSLYEGSINVSPDKIMELTTQNGLIKRFSGYGPFQEPLRIIARSIILPDRKEPVIVMVAADRRPVDKTIQHFTFASSWVLIIFVVGLIFAVVYQVRYGLSPLIKLKQAISDVRGGKSDRVIGDYPIEIKPLAEELNSLINHNKNIVERARTHVGNLAHALKTPLSILTNEVYPFKDNRQSLAKTVEKQTKIMVKQVDHHLNKARATARATKIGSKTDVSQVIEDLVRTLAKIYQDKALNISYQSQQKYFFRGERQDFEEMIGNLLDNACKWAKKQVYIECTYKECPVSDSIKLNLGSKNSILQKIKAVFFKKANSRQYAQFKKETKSSGFTDQPSFIRILVEDDGPGLPEKHLDTVLKRGERLDEKQPGSGLGLSIVNDLSHDYGGKLYLKTSKLGGLKVILFLPTSMQ